MRPVLCLITDRTRAASDDDLVARVAAAARAGVHLIQVRERDLDGGPLLRLVERCVTAVRGTAARVLVNDRLDVALAAAAHGVHLRSDSMPARRARAIVPHGFLIGRSVHEGDGSDAGDGADYLMFGTVFDTPSKPGRAASGARGLAAVAASTPIPVLGVGGITIERAAEAARAGAAGVAAIGLFADAPPEALSSLVERLSASFDTSRTVPRQ